MFHGRKGGAGCGRWEPPSWPYPRHDETALQGETGAEELNQMAGVRVKFPKYSSDRRQKSLHQTTV